MTLAPEVFMEAFEFSNEIETLEPLLFILRRFIEQLSRRLESVYLVAGELKLVLTLASATTCERNFKVPSPTRNVETLFRMVFTHLENCTTPSPITALTLEAIPSRTESHQFSLFETSLRDPNHFFETIGRLNSLLGPGRVGTPVLQDSHRPDDFKMESVKFKDLEEEFTAKRGRRAALNEVGESFGLKQGMALRRFRPPLPAEVKMEEDRPAHLNTAKVRGRIAHAAGPWRVSGQWWEKPWVREEWDIETATGRLCRIFQDGTNWFLEGVFD
jgi:protein ImuB